MRSGGRLSGRLGGRSFRLRLPGYGRSSLARGASVVSRGSAAATSRGSAASASRDAAFDAAFRAPLVAKSSRSRLVPSPLR
jgi:hypothetical protein